MKKLLAVFMIAGLFGIVACSGGEQPAEEATTLDEVTEQAADIADDAADAVSDAAETMEEAADSTAAAVEGAADEMGEAAEEMAGKATGGGGN